MSHELDPKVGRWYRRVDDEQLFKVASIDEDDGLIEIKNIEGEVEELDAAEWVELDLEYAEAPEDYVDPDDASKDKDKDKDEDDWEDDDEEDEDEDEDDWDEDDDSDR